MPVKKAATKSKSAAKKNPTTGDALPKSAAKPKSSATMAAKLRASAKKPLMKFFSVELDTSSDNLNKIDYAKVASRRASSSQIIGNADETYPAVFELAWFPSLLKVSSFYILEQALAQS